MGSTKPAVARSAQDGRHRPVDSQFSSILIISLALVGPGAPPASQNHKSQSRGSHLVEGKIGDSCGYCGGGPKSHHHLVLPGYG